VTQQELKQLLTNVRLQRDDWQERAKKNEEASNQLIHVQQVLETTQIEICGWQEKVAQIDLLYLSEQQRYQQTLSLYSAEKARAADFLARYEQANAERTQYLALYNEAQEQLKFERRSKAGIKGWETRRKRENEYLKQEIAEMTVLLRDSLTRKDEAINTLYALSERMDRIQHLVDSVEEAAAKNPVDLLQKFKRIWSAIKEILDD
jgi:hypothetical protein